MGVHTNSNCGCGGTGSGGGSTPEQPGNEFLQNNVGRKINAGIVTIAPVANNNLYDAAVAIKVAENLNTVVLTITEIHTPVIVDVIVFTQGSLGSKKHKLFFSKGKGKYGPGGTTLLPGDFELFYTQNLLIGDITDGNAYATFVDLGNLLDGDYLSAANSAERDFIDEGQTYFITYNKDGKAYLLKFEGEPGYYGGSYPDSFILENFLPASDSDVQPEITRTDQLQNTGANGTDKYATIPEVVLLDPPTANGQVIKKGGLKVLLSGIEALWAKITGNVEVTGNVSSGLAPTEPEHLTRKDWVNGMNISVNQATAELFLKNADGTNLATINLAFLNNEGTTFYFNDDTQNLELKNDDGEVLSVVPASSFVTGLIRYAGFNGATPHNLEFKDPSNNIVATVPVGMVNVQGLITALNSKANADGSNAVPFSNWNINAASSFTTEMFGDAYGNFLNDGEAITHAVGYDSVTNRVRRYTAASFKLWLLSVMPEITRTDQLLNNGEHGQSKYIEESKLFKGLEVEYPNELKFRPLRIFESDKNYIVNITPKDLVKDKISKMKPYYVNYQTGSNTNDGLTESTAFKTIAVAYAYGARLIYLTGGIHKIDSWSLLNSAYANIDDLIIIGVGKEPNIVCSAPAITPTITLQSGSTYQATDVNIRMVVDMKFVDKCGFPLKLNEFFSIADVNTNTGSYYYDTATNNLYFNLPDGRVPDVDVLLLTRLRNAEYRANAGYHYVENITFMGGGTTTGTHGVQSELGSNSKLIHLGQDCNFIYGQALNYTSNGGEGTRNLYNKVNWFHNCIAYNNARDGFNYLSDSNNPMNFIEVDAQSFENDWRLASTNTNGSSFHGPGYGIRVNVKAYKNSGPNIADVDGAIVFNVGCTAFKSTALNPSFNSDFAVETNAGLPATKMFLYDCISLNDNSSYSITGLHPAYIYVHPINYKKGAIQLITPSAPQQIVEGEFNRGFSPTYYFPPLSSYTAKAVVGRSYKVYTALITQTGTTAPTVTVLENTIGGTPTWAYIEVGYYTLTIPGAFPNTEKVACIISPYWVNISTNNQQYRAKKSVDDINTIDVRTTLGNSATNGMLSSGSVIEIRVYN